MPNGKARQRQASAACPGVYVALKQANLMDAKVRWVAATDHGGWRTGRGLKGTSRSIGGVGPVAAGCAWGP